MPLKRGPRDTELFLRSRWDLVCLLAGGFVWHLWCECSLGVGLPSSGGSRQTGPLALRGATARTTWTSPGLSCGLSRFLAFFEVRERDQKHQKTQLRVGLLPECPRVSVRPVHHLAQRSLQASALPAPSPSRMWCHLALSRSLWIDAEGGPGVAPS